MNVINALTHSPFWRKNLHQYARKLLCRSSGEERVLLVWDGLEWSDYSTDAGMDVGPFGQAVWLVAASSALFHKCSFPADMLSKNDIEEAVRLDLTQWSPWGDTSGLYYIPVREGDRWDVFIWVWDADLELQEQELYSPHCFTHVIPEDVWMAGAIAQSEQLSLTVFSSKNRYRYILVDRDGTPKKLAWVDNVWEAKVFMRSLGVEKDDLEVVNIQDDLNAGMIPWLPDLQVQTQSMECLAGVHLERGRLPDVVDWRDPMAWKPVLVSVVVLLMVWMLGSTAVVWSKQEMVDAALSQAREGGDDVLSDRKITNRLDTRLTAMHALQSRQSRPVLLMYELSRILPKDVWLQSAHFKNGMFEIKGQGENAVALAGILESMPYVKKASYIGDIRPIANSKQQSFGILLYLEKSVE